ncbi:hypothetical protein PLESTB_000498300 [Pleodorina starrii]|uniref:Uncharacterized protein n=1 Tax=Pleodorina starrii TaxID=330485 RepID=A0A9W6F036_9CHLO|nr:hypothetical protein PLESTM_000369700 [Pleodorina starrii]GLC51402.1 hypothetical protein PLESTB_000498300 [Pleodorina starrii]GLC63768.1 hypothetical protein PLESTF_000071900 [Pleodorina starrii]
MAHGTPHCDRSCGSTRHTWNPSLPHPSIAHLGRRGWALPGPGRTTTAVPRTRNASERRCVRFGSLPASHCAGQQARDLHGGPPGAQEECSSLLGGAPATAAAAGLATNGTLTADDEDGATSEQPTKHHSGHSGTPPRITRRVTGGLLLAASAAAMGGYGGLGLLRCGAAQARPPPPLPLPLPPCSGPLDGQLAAALTRAVYSSVVQLQIMDEADFQRENFKLREREYRYYAEANRSQLPRIPDLADNTGGLSNPAYFNFIGYCLWKVVYRHIAAPQDREAFARAVAAEFLAREGLLGPQDVEPEPRAAAVAAAAAASPEAAVRDVVLPFLELLRAGGYICRYQLVLGSHPGTWPQDWMVSQPTVLTRADADVEEDGEGDGAAGVDSSAGSGSRAGAGEFLFQLKLHRPADILSSVALRSEEGGAWPRTVSRCLLMLLERRGYRAAGPTPPTAAAAAEGQLPFEEGPGGGGGDGKGQSEAEAEAEVDEFFYQDVWEGPKSLSDRLLLLLGDPLEQVGVDFVPTTLVQNWRLRRW